MMDYGNFGEVYPAMHNSSINYAFIKIYEG